MRRNYERDARIRDAINESLSGVNALPTLRYKVLQAARGEQKVKKKISLAFVQAMLLLVIAVSALATTTMTDMNGDPINTTQSMSQPTPIPTASATPMPMAEPTPIPQITENPLNHWDDETVLTLCRLLYEDGMDVSIGDYEAILMAEKPGDAARALLESHYSDPVKGGNRGSIFWPWNIKALECELMQYHHHWDMSWERYVAPVDGVIFYEDAREAAIVLLYNRFTMPENFADTYDLDAALVLLPGETEPVWRFRWWLGEVYYEAVLTASGAPLRWKTPYSMTYTPDTDVLAEGTVLDVDLEVMEQLIEDTRMMITEIGYVARDGGNHGFDPADVAAAKFTLAHITHPGFNYGLRPVWILEMHVDGELLGRVLRDENGDYICTAFGSRDFQRTVHRDLGTIDRLLDSSAIYDADASTKAALWSEWKPLADAYLDVNPTWSNGTSYYFTQKKTYVFPPEGALTSAQAADIAREQAISLGASVDTMAYRRVLESCLMEDGRAVWCMTLMRVDQELAGLSGEEWMENFHHNIFVITLDAVSGEVVHSLLVEEETPNWLWRY